MLMVSTDEMVSVGKLIEIYLALENLPQKKLFSVVSGASDSHRFKQVSSLLANTSGRPSRDLLTTIAKYLRLTERQYTYLLRAADYPPEASEGLAGILLQQQGMLQRSIPACVIDYRAQIWSWNTAFEALCADASNGPTPSQTYLRLHPGLSLLQLLFDPTSRLRAESDPDSWRAFTTVVLRWFWRSTRKMTYKGWDKTTPDGVALWLEELTNALRALPETGPLFTAMWTAAQSESIPNSQEQNYLTQGLTTGRAMTNDDRPILRWHATQRDVILLRDLPGPDMRFSILLFSESEH